MTFYDDTDMILVAENVKAVVVAPMFQRKVLDLANVSGARMQCASDAESRGRDTDRVDWSRFIKSSRPAVAKVSDQYNGAPQYLADLVRHRLIFDSVHAQYLCLASICQDQDIVVVRIDNGQHNRSHKKMVQRHIRDQFEKPWVTVYFILTTPEAYDMGVSGHLLELELVKLEIWQLFGRSHDSFVAYRRALLSEQSVTSRALRRLIATAVPWQVQRGRADVVALPNICTADEMEARSVWLTTHVESEEHQASSTVGSCTLASHMRSCQHTDSSTMLEIGEEYMRPRSTDIPARDINSFFQVNLDEVKECFQIGTCADKQAIPPVLYARLGYCNRVLNLDSFFESEQNPRLKEIFDTLCAHPHTAVRSSHDQSLRDKPQYKAPAFGVAPIIVQPEEAQRFQFSTQEEVCVMSQEMRDVLRRKCQERGDAKAHSLLEVFACIIVLHACAVCRT